MLFRTFVLQSISHDSFSSKSSPSPIMPPCFRPSHFQKPLTILSRILSKNSFFSLFFVHTSISCFIFHCHESGKIRVFETKGRTRRRLRLKVFLTMSPSEDSYPNLSNLTSETTVFLFSSRSFECEGSRCRVSLLIGCPPHPLSLFCLRTIESSLPCARSRFTNTAYYQNGLY